MSIHMDWPGHEKVLNTNDFVTTTGKVVGDGAVAICLMDLDEFGRLNQEHGHAAGDHVLQVWARTLEGSVPTGSIVRRLGGDEFAVALPNTSAEDALIVFNELRQHLLAHPVEGSDWTIQATFGVAARPPHADSLESLLQCANAALMRGKREGGGRVAIYVEEKMVLKSNYYPRGDLDRLSRLAGAMSRTEASLLREALSDLFAKHPL
jgi:diguanylate cyclase